MKHRILSSIFSGIWAVQRQHAEAMLHVVASLMLGNENVIDNSNDHSEARAAAKKIQIYSPTSKGAYTISDYGLESPPEAAPEGSISVMNITDTITKYDQFCGPSGTQTKSDLLLRADANKNIKAHILKMDTPGGEGYGAFDFANTIRNDIKKPIVAFVDDLSASAGYMIACACDNIVAKNKITQVGSIGTYVTIADFTKRFESMGIKLKDVYATLSTDKNKPVKDALAGDNKALVAEIDKFNDEFLSLVNDFRGTSLQAKQKEWGTGKMFMAEEAINMGLIDQIGSFNNTVQSLLIL